MATPAKNRIDDVAYATIVTIGIYYLRSEEVC